MYVYSEINVRDGNMEYHSTEGGQKFMKKGDIHLCEPSATCKDIGMCFLNLLLNSDTHI